MKNISPIHSSAPAGIIAAAQGAVNPVASSPPLKVVVDEFLASKKPETRAAYQYQLQGLVRAFGDLPLDRVMTVQIHQFVRNPNHTPRVQRQRLGLTQAVFNLGRKRDYLPRHQRTAADSVKVIVPNMPPPVLTPFVFKRLLEGTRVVELLLWMVLSAFAGLRSRELEGLSWDAIRPGTSIEMPRDSKGGYRRSIPMHPALDVWLRPFYGCQGKVFKSRNLRHRLMLHARTLGIGLRLNALRASYAAHLMTQSCDPVLVAGVLGHRSAWATYRPCLRITLQDATEYFALTPEAVGITNWPEMVAQYLNSQPDNQA
jgi:integrase